MTARSRWILAVAALVMAAAFILPLWRVDLIAPQYPEGLGMLIRIDRVDGLKENDLNSINGVLLNGRRVERAVLCDEDVLAIGPFRLKVQVPDDWVTQGSPLPDDASISDTAVMPLPAEESPAIWRIK